jgi:hypothetical protein
MSTANVQLDALRETRIALIKFIETAGMALADADSDIVRTLNWLELEQVPHWATQIRRREELVSRCKDAVRQKLLYKDSTGGRSSAVDEIKQLKKAEAMLLEAQEKFTASKLYVRRIQKGQMEYKGQVQKLGLALTGNLAAAVAKLQSLQNVVADYAKLETPTETRSMAQSADQMSADPIEQPAPPAAPATSPAPAAPTEG